MQSYLVFQPVYRYFKTVANTNKVTAWLSKSLSDENIKPPHASNNSTVLALNYINTKLQVKFDRICLKQDKVTFTHTEVVNTCIVYEINLWPFNSDKDFALENCLFGAVKLIKNADPANYTYSGCGTGFNACGSFLLSDGSGLGKNVIIFGADMSSSIHIDNKKYISYLILGKDPTDSLDDTTLTVEKEYYINLTEQQQQKIKNKIIFFKVCIIMGWIVI